MSLNVFILFSLSTATFATILDGDVARNAILKSNRVPKPINQVVTMEQDDDICSECKGTIKALVDILKNPNDEQVVKRHLLETCPYISIFMDQDKCQKLINNNFKAFMKLVVPMLENEYDACSTMYICDAAEDPRIFHRSMLIILGAHVRSLKSGTGLQGVVCEECQFAINEFKALLADKRFQAAVEAKMKRMCGLLGSFKDECTLLADQYFPMILTTLQSYTGDPQAVCGDVGLCSAPHVQMQKEASAKAMLTPKYQELRKVASTLMTLQQPEKPSPAGCITCMLVFTTAINVLEFSNLTQWAIVNDIKNDCRAFLPDEIAKQAESFLDLYGTTALTMAMRQISAQKICQLLTACSKPSAEFLMQQTPAAFKGLQCDACQGAVAFLAGELKTPALQNEIVDLLSEICNVYPASDKAKRDACTSGIKANVPAYVYQIGALMDTTEVCKDIGVC